MPYFSIAQIRHSLVLLKESNTFLISLLCMLRLGIPVTNRSQNAVRFGSADELALLREYFRVSGLPPGRPFFTVFGREQGQSVDEKYPARTLQRLRKEASEIFWHPNPNDWSFRRNYSQKLLDGPRFSVREISLSALCVWFYRQKEIASVSAAINRFIEEFQLDRDDLIGRNFMRDEENFRDEDMLQVCVSDSDLALELGLALPPSDPPPRTEFRSRLNDAMSSRKLVLNEKVLETVIVAWLARDIVVLVGAPGTGKSTIAHALPAAIEKALGSEGSVVNVNVQITSETDISVMIGYQNLEGSFVPSEFTSYFLMNESLKLRTCIAVIDEFNLANADAYLAPILASIESQQPIHLAGTPPGNGYLLPVDTFIIATCNSFIDEPGTRLPLSGPVKRRCTVITMPNVLAETAAKTSVRQAFSELGTGRILSELDEIERRFTQGSATAFDRYRREMLRSCSSYENLADDVRECLEAIGTAMFESPSGRLYFTIGVYRDVLLSLVMSQENDRMFALSQQMVNKIIHTFSGPIDVIRAASSPLKGTAGYHLIEEMLALIESRDFGTGLVPPLV